MFEMNSFTVGCNYWASHAGPLMWRDWRPEVVRDDFAALASAGVRLVRVFPLWPDFQPIEVIRGIRGRAEGISTDGAIFTLGDGMDETMLVRFGEMLDYAEEAGLKVLPSLITGWMSGRLYVPRALDGLNVITDPTALQWEGRFCRTFVRRFRDRKCIVGWCLGNECNCMGEAETEAQAWLWTSLLSSIIRAEDTERPVVSGMHSLKARGEGVWTCIVQGECCDLLTTHPYASPSYKTDAEPVTEMRALLHPACQTVIYRDLSGKPCFIEETGTYGEMYCDRDLTAAYARGSMLNAWAHGCLSWLWWIGFDQYHLHDHPFGYNNRASSYGLFTEAREIKPVGETVRELSAFFDEIGPLPPAIEDGVILIPDGSEHWPGAAGAWMLAARAGMNLRFASIEEPLPDAPLYLLPSLTSNSISAHAITALMGKVAAGASLYISVGGSGLLRNLGRDFGFHITSRTERRGGDTFRFGEWELPAVPGLRYDITPTTAEVLARAKDGTPVYTCASYGQGKLYFLAWMMEKTLWNTLDGLNGEHWRLYSVLRRSSGRMFTDSDPMVTVTEHPDSGRRLIVAVNNSGETRHLTLTSEQMPVSVRILRGQGAACGGQIMLTIPAADAAVIEIAE